MELTIISFSHYGVGFHKKKIKKKKQIDNFNIATNVSDVYYKNRRGPKDYHLHFFFFFRNT